MAKNPADELTEQQAEALATAALRRALTTPYKPQSKMKIGAKKKTLKVKNARKS